jgi:hypothetical protein
MMLTVDAPADRQALAGQDPGETPAGASPRSRGKDSMDEDIRRGGTALTVADFRTTNILEFLSDELARDVSRCPSRG